MCEVPSFIYPFLGYYGHFKTLGNPGIRSRCLFYKMLKWAFVRIHPVNDLAKFEVGIASPFPEIIAIGVSGFLVGIANPQPWGRRGRI